MNKYLIIVLLLVLTQAIHAQSVFPEPKDKAIWNIGFWRFFENAYDFTVHPSKDTLLCGKKWIKANITNLTITHLFYRVEGKKVYLRMNENCIPEDHLIYDFGLNVGDTLYVPTNLAETGGYSSIRGVRVTVDSTATIVINGVTRKRMVVTYRYRYKGTNPVFYEDRQDEWIEGMGSRLFPFYAMACVNHGNCETSYWYVRCFQINDEMVYKDQRSPFCSPLVSTSNQAQQQRLPIQLYPNPLESGQALYIDAQSLSDKPSAYQIIDLLGCVKTDGKLEAYSIDRISIQLDVLPKGFYQLRLLNRHGQQLALEKLIVH